MSTNYGIPTVARAVAISMAVVISAVSSLPAHAGTKQLAPIAADIAHLGVMSAITYYTVEQDGYRVVTTIQEDTSDTATPVRFVTTLQAGQKAIVSVPGCAPGAPSWALELVREGDHLVVHHSTEKPPMAAAN
jgi:hypothetical protein